MKFRERPRSSDSLQSAAATTSRKWRSLLSAVLAAVGIALALPAGLAQTGAEAPRAKPPFPSFDLPDRSQGERAISRLANRLPEVAAWYGMTVPEFTRLLREDRTAWLDRKGRVFFQEEIQFPLQTITSPLTSNPLSPSFGSTRRAFRPFIFYQVVWRGCAVPKV